MSPDRTTERPDWLDRSLYPFDSQYLSLAEGRLHYVDRGTGSPVLAVHGTPTWSFLYRELIASLSDRYRVVAPDHLGFGLSEKPEAAGYRPADHAERLARLVDRLGLEGITLVVHDFGGPIGLSYAVERPENVDRLVLCNTWLWSLDDDRTARWASRLARGPVGRLLYRRFNVSPRLLLKLAWGDRTALTAAVHRHYTGPFGSPGERTAPWVLARELIGSGEWYESLWGRRSRLRDKPALVCWGLADPAFGESYLERWEGVLADAEVVRLPDVGHFVPDEAAATVVTAVTAFLGDR